MRSSLKERLGQLGPIRVISRNGSGSPADAVLCARQDGHPVDTIAAALALQNHAGLTMMEAKHLLEDLLALRVLKVVLPQVSGRDELQATLTEAGSMLRSIWAWWKTAPVRQ